MSLETIPRDTRETDGSIGIGAMIVFIALILVAAVASTIIIKTAEELQQNAENTSSDTRQQISGKVSIADVYVKTTADPLHGGTNTDIATMEVIARVDEVTSNLVTYFITCANAAGDDLVIDTNTIDAAGAAMVLVSITRSSPAALAQVMK
jgi:hypothetical protein